MEDFIRILQLEDDPADADLVQAMLNETGLSFHMTLTQSREEFKTAVCNGGMDIILSDYRLPMYDGMSALQLVLEECPDIPFIFVSGAMGEEAAIEGLTDGNKSQTAGLLKISPNTLRSKLRSYRIDYVCKN